MYKLALLPFDQFDQAAIVNFEKKDIDINNLFGEQAYQGFSSGKAVIKALMEFHNLSRKDEVYISTTTDTSFVSSCVTSTIFNYCKVSRVITNKTKLIFVIHEFGYPNKKIDELVEYGQERGIPVVEDVAHSMNSTLNGQRLGCRADYSLFSLPKIFPVNSGGLLIVNKKGGRKTYNTLEHKNCMRDLNRWLCYLDSFTKKKKEIEKIFIKSFSNYNAIFESSDEVNPFVFGFEVPGLGVLESEFDQLGIEIAKTYVKDRILLPLNPFAKVDKVGEIVVDIKQYLNK